MNKGILFSQSIHRCFFFVACYGAAVVLGKRKESWLIQRDYGGLEPHHHVWPGCLGRWEVRAFEGRGGLTLCAMFQPETVCCDQTGGLTRPGGCVKERK